MSLIWLPEEEHFLRLQRAKHSYQEISDQFSVRFRTNTPGFRCERSAEAVRKKCTRDNITPENSKTYTDWNNPYTQFVKKMCNLQTEFEIQGVERQRGLISSEKIARKILALSDIHFPFARMNLIDNILNEHDDADIVVLNGDILEGYMHSRYEKAKRISALIEYRLAFDFVQMLSKRFPKVYLVSGNHDIRVATYLKKEGFTKEQSQILRPDLLARIANGEELDATGMLVKKHDFNNVYYDQNESWYVRIGKTIFAHPHGRGSSQPGFTVKKVNSVFSKRYTENEYDSIVVGHTHKLYKGIVNSRLLIEQGFLAGVLGYAHSPRMNFTTNGQNGYALIYQDAEGNTAFNYSGFVFCGETNLPKKTAAI